MGKHQQIGTGRGPAKLIAFIFRSGYEQNSVVKSRPGGWLRTSMIGPKHYFDFSFFGTFQDLITGALGMLGIFGMDVQNRTKILIDG